MSTGHLAQKSGMLSKVGSFMADGFGSIRIVDAKKIEGRGAVGMRNSRVNLLNHMGNE